MGCVNVADSALFQDGDDKHLCTDKNIYIIIMSRRNNSRLYIKLISN